jgi:hypothetical protein
MTNIEQSIGRGCYEKYTQSISWKLNLEHFNRLESIIERAPYSLRQRGCLKHAPTMENTSETLTAPVGTLDTHYAIFDFLSLSGELQNLIYDYCAINEEKAFIILQGRSKGKVTSASPFHFVCRQIAKDFEPRLAHTAPVIVAKVTNLEFDGLRTYCRRINSSRPNLSASSEIFNGSRQLDVLLSLTHAAAIDSSPERMLCAGRWLSTPVMNHKTSNVHFALSHVYHEDSILDWICSRFRGPSWEEGCWAGVRDALLGWATYMVARQLIDAAHRGRIEGFQCPCEACQE